MSKRLKIGISSCFFHADPQRAVFKGKTLLYVEESLAHWVMSRGALAYPIPTVHAGTPFELDALTEELDGLVLHGGADLSPRSYGQEPLRPEWSGDGIRDQYELKLVRAFKQAGKPILGICRGLQLLNVAYGGTLLQDIQTQSPASLQHRNWDIYDHNRHEVDLVLDSALAKVLGKETGRTVNSVHHQSVEKLGAGLEIMARCPQDGIIEAFRDTSPSQWVWAVQWHPEFEHETKKALQPHERILDSTPLLLEFIREAEKRRKPQ